MRWASKSPILKLIFFFSIIQLDICQHSASVLCLVVRLRTCSLFVRIELQVRSVRGPWVLSLPVCIVTCFCHPSWWCQWHSPTTPPSLSIVSTRSHEYQCPNDDKLESGVSRVIFTPLHSECHCIQHNNNDNDSNVYFVVSRSRREVVTCHYLDQAHHPGLLLVVTSSIICIKLNDWSDGVCIIYTVYQFPHILIVVRDNSEQIRKDSHQPKQHFSSMK